MYELGTIYSDGETIFKKGDKGDCMYVIQSGKITIKSGGVTLTSLKSGDLFGEMSLFDKMPRSADAVADGEARLLRVDRAKLFRTINNDPTLVFRIFKSMSDRVRELSDEVEELRKR